MALPLLAIGTALPQGGTGITQLHSKGLSKGASFGSSLQQKLDQLGADGSDLLSQLAGMLQAGTPLATIIDRVAKTVSSALTSASGAGGNTTRRGTLERALAAALAPPGTSPPNQSGYEQAASLERRLGDLLSRISGELKNAGQQNRFSGAVLDANSAREIPAQQQMKDAAGAQPAGSLASAESILRNALQPAPDRRAAQSATDVLGRMLARAATADAQRSGQNAAPAAPALSVHAAPSPSVSPSELFARLLNAIAQSSNEGASRDGGRQSQDFAFAKNAVPAIHHAFAPSNSVQTPAFAAAMTTATASAPQSQSLPATPQTIDPQAVIEQVVKGISMRNFGTTSEVRMRLQPEHLGDVSLKLTVSGNTLSANIVAQNADVRDLLMQNQQQLVRTLSEAGLSLGNFSVDISGGNPGFSEQQTQQHRALSKAGALHADAAEDDAWADSRFGPPLVSGAKSLVLNYLA